MNRTIAQMSSRKATAGNTTRKFISGTYNQDTKASRQTAVNKERPLGQSAVFSIKSRDFTRRLAIDGTLLQIGPLVTGDFALAHPELSFYFAIFPIELENDERATFYLCFAIQLVDLLAM